MTDKIKTFKDLIVWQKGIVLVKLIYAVTRDFPREEVYGLSAQMRRSSVSIPANIAEGFRRRYAKEHKQFLNIALGSCAELETHVIIAKELNYINEVKTSELCDIIDHVSAMIVNLSKKI